jgi:imidazoleglycerol phosphate dehydratase HisB
LISAVRLALRRAGIDRGEIRRFSQQALGMDDAEGQRRLCRQWVDVEAPSGARG